VSSLVMKGEGGRSLKVSLDQALITKDESRTFVRIGCEFLSGGYVRRPESREVHLSQERHAERPEEFSELYWVGATTLGPDRLVRNRMG